MPFQCRARLSRDVWSYKETSRNGAGTMVLALLLSLSLAAAPSVTGVVKDSSGGAVSGAAVLLETPAGVQQQTVTGPDGRYTFETAPTEPTTLVIRAGG